VLDCLQGYILLLDSVSPPGFGGAWNFGPNPEDLWSVLDVVTLAKEIVTGLDYVIVKSEIPYLETDFLNLDSRKIKAEIDWQPRASPQLSVPKALAEVLPSQTLGVREILEAQIKEHESGW